MAYIKRDGNGGINISKSAMAFVTIMALLLGMLSTAAYAYGVLNQKVDTLEDVWDDVSTDHKDYTENIEERLSDVELFTAKVGVSLEDIKDDLDEIKGDIKDVKKELNGHTSGGS